VTRPLSVAAPEHPVTRLRRLTAVATAALLACSEGNGPSDTDFFLGAIPAVGPGFQCVLRPDGRAHCWGENQYGQTGTGLAALLLERPTPVAGGLLFDTIVSGVLHVCGLTAEGAAHCWGGPGGPGRSLMTPQPVGPELRFTLIAAGDWQTCGITGDRRAYCWTAVGTVRGPAWIPRPVLGTADLVSLSTSHNSSCGLSASGEVACWGTAVARYIPGDDHWEVDSAIAAPSGTALATLSAGASHVCGFAGEDHSLQCIGLNLWGELGDGTQERRTEWTTIPQPGDGFSAVHLALWRSVGVDRDGRLWVWGKAGALDVTSLTPRPVLPDVRWSAFDLEYTSYCGVTTDGQFGCLASWDAEGVPEVVFADAPEGL
jgi:alpha-tubulin suppressor-like RCC1 family protein